MAINTFKKNTENFNQNKIQIEEKINPQAENSGKMDMVTIDRKKAENFLIALEECVGDVEEQKNLVDNLIKTKNEELQRFQSETIEKFNILIQSTTELAEKIKAADSYENYLAEKLENANLSKSVTMLEQQLQKEKSELSSFIIKIENFITLKIGEIESKVNDLETINEMVENKLETFKKELQGEVRKTLEAADSKIDESSDSLINGARVQYEALKADCNSMIKSYTEKCQQHLDTIKKQSLDFLKQCEIENKKLIEKVPAVANKKISIKDILIFTVSGTAIISVLCQLFFC